MKQSMARVGRYIDNALWRDYGHTESCYDSKQSLVQTTEGYMRYYNSRRVQRNPSVLTPWEKYALAMAT